MHKCFKYTDYKFHVATDRMRRPERREGYGLRIHCRSGLLIIVMLMLLFTVSPAQPTGYKPVGDEAAFRNKLKATAQATQTIKSNFIQEKNLNFVSEKITSKGTFRFKKQNKVRMEYVHPFKYLLIINQEKVIIRDEQKTNSFSSKSNKLFTTINNIIMDCVQGTALENKEFKAQIFMNEKSYLMIFKPVKKEMQDFFESIHVYLELSSGNVYKIDMMEPSGDNTVITFTDREINAPIPDSEFNIH